MRECECVWFRLVKVKGYVMGKGDTLQSIGEKDVGEGEVEEVEEHRVTYRSK